MSPLELEFVHVQKGKLDDPIPQPFDLIVRLQSVKSHAYESSGCVNEKNESTGLGGESEPSESENDGSISRVTWHSPLKKYLGLLLTLVASLCLSFSIVFAKLLQQFEYHGNCTSFWRYIGVTVPTIPILIIAEYGSRKRCKESANGSCNSSIFATIWPLTQNDKWKTAVGVFLRGLLASSAVVLRYYALEYLPIGDTVVIAYSTPVLVTVLAHFMLGEKAGVVSFGVAFCALVGVAIVAKPPILTGDESFTTETMLGTSLAVASLLCSALQLILTRKIRTVHFTIVTLSGGLIGLVISGCLMLYFQDFQYPAAGLASLEGLYVTGLASTSFLGQIALVLALKWEKAGPVALLRSSDILFGFIFQYLFMNVVPAWTSMVGASLIVSGVLVTGIRKWCQDLPDGDKRKNSLRFLLA